MADFETKVRNYGTPIVFFLIGADKLPMSLTGDNFPDSITITLRSQKAPSTVLVNDGVCGVIQGSTYTDPQTRKKSIADAGQYWFVEPQLDDINAGDYNAEVTVTWQPGMEITFPNNSKKTYFTVKILPRLDVVS